MRKTVRLALVGLMAMMLAVVGSAAVSADPGYLNNGQYVSDICDNKDDVNCFTKAGTYVADPAGARRVVVGNGLYGVGYGYPYGGYAGVYQTGVYQPVYGGVYQAGVYQTDTAPAGIVAVTYDARYCDGRVFVTQEQGVLVDRCANGLRVFPNQPDYYAIYR